MGGIIAKKPWRISSTFSVNRGMSPEGRYQQVFPVWTTAVTANMKQLAAATSDNLIHLFCLITEQRLISLVGHGDTIWQVAYSPDDRFLASTSADGTVRLWEVETGLPALVLMRCHANWCWSLAWSPDALELATGGSDTMISIWRPAEAVLAAEEKAAADARVEPSGFDASSLSYAAEMSEAATRAAMSVLNWQAHEKSVLSLAFAPRDAKKLISAGGEGTVAMWSVTSGELVFRLNGHIGAVNSVAISSSFSSLIATGGDDHTVRIWDGGDMNSAMVYKSRDSPEGFNLAHHILKGHLEPVSTVRFCCKGSLLASTGKDCDVRIWSVSTEQLLLKEKFAAHDSWVRAVVWAPDREKLFTCSTDGLVYCWRVPKHYNASSKGKLVGDSSKKYEPA